MNQNAYTKCIALLLSVVIGLVWHCCLWLSYIKLSTALCSAFNCPLAVVNYIAVCGYEVTMLLVI